MDARMKKLALLLLLVCAVARADDITFNFGNGGNVFNLTSAAPGMRAGPAGLLSVSDTVKGLEFPLAGEVNAKTGPASLISVTPTLYIASYGAGGEVTIFQGGTPLLTGSPMFDRSNLTSNLAEDTGSFQGEFAVTSVNPTILAKFGLGPAFKPDGSFSLTFAESAVSGTDLKAIIGGGSITIETPTVIPEPSTATLLYFGVPVLLVAWYRKRRSTI